MLGSDKLNGLDLGLCLHQVLVHVTDHPIAQIDELLPLKVIIPTQYDHTKFAYPYNAIPNLKDGFAHAASFVAHFNSVWPRIVASHISLTKRSSSSANPGAMFSENR